MRVWRLARSVYPALDGEGSRLYGGRWNEPGTPVVYTAGSLSLAVVEQVVHLDPSQLPDDYVAYAVEIPDGLEVERVKISDLPDQWNRRAEVRSLQRMGEQWAREQNAAVLSVPSAVIPEERNYLINPRHADSDQIDVVHGRPFDFDPRLFK